MEEQLWYLFIGLSGGLYETATLMHQLMQVFGCYHNICISGIRLIINHYILNPLKVYVESW